MNKIIVVSALGLALLSARPSSAAWLNDEVIAYLTQNGIAFSPGDYSTCQDVGPDHICTWNATKLGAQPTAGQLQAFGRSVDNKAAALAGWAPLVAAGLQITSTVTPALSGTYALDPASVGELQGLILGYSARGSFPHGAATYTYHGHEVTITQLTTIGSAIEDYLSDLAQTRDALSKGNDAEWPINQVIIP